jgi:hypothetical protein
VADPHKTDLAAFPSNKVKNSATRTPERTRGIPQSVEAQLLTDIEAFGGLTLLLLPLSAIESLKSTVRQDPN